MTLPPGTIGRKPMGNPTIRAQAPDNLPVAGSDLRITSTETQEIRSHYYGEPSAPTPNHAANALASGANFLRGLAQGQPKPLSLPTKEDQVASAAPAVIPADNRKEANASLVVQAVSPQPVPPVPSASGSVVDPASLVQKAMAAYQKMDGVIVRFNRRERIGNTNHPEETILLALRRDTFAVHMKWLGEVGGGREVVYNPKLDEKRMTVVTAPGDIPFMSGGKRMALDINSSLVRNSTRYAITDTGFLSMINRLAGNIEAFNRGAFTGGSVISLGSIRRPEFPGEVDAVEIKMPAGAEKEFPGGGKRLMCFSKENNLPVLLITWDEKGTEMEYMKYDRFQFLHLDDQDFDPEFLFPAPGKAPGQTKPVTPPMAK